MGKIIDKTYDFVVVGGGLSGMCASIAAARKGVHTALVHDRPVLGGNASSEIRMHICGANRHGQNPNARETGILEEILLENKRRNPHMVYPIFDMILWEKVRFQENLDLFLNCYANQVEVENDKIRKVTAFQMTSEREYHFYAKLFLDSTGDGSIGEKAGAIYRVGREARSEFGENLAPEEADTATMGNSMMFKARDMEENAPFICPDWANQYTEQDLKNRDHTDATSGYWWNELGGTRYDTIDDAQEINEELLKSLAGLWDHIKNGGDHAADQLELEWVGFLPAKRESRRFVGDYILKQSDIDEKKVFEDAVAYGGWTMDLHTADGLLSADDVPTVWNPVKEWYTVPYRCLYSKNIRNLFLGGRIISCSHVAFSSSRVMGTCAVVGQAVGTAASIAVEKHIDPREVGSYIQLLQRELMKDDCFIPGYCYEDKENFAATAEITASSHEKGCEPRNVMNGYARADQRHTNCWRSKITEGLEPELTLNFNEIKTIHEIRLIFDSNLSKEITPSINKSVLERQDQGSPIELVRDYEIEFLHNGKIRNTLRYKSEGQRLNILCFDEGIKKVDAVRVRILSTYGSKFASVFEVRIY